MQTAKQIEHSSAGVPEQTGGVTLPRRIAFCGALNGAVLVRKYETVDQALERAELAIQAALDRSCRRLDVSVGVDFGSWEEGAVEVTA